MGRSGGREGAGTGRRGRVLAATGWTAAILVACWMPVGRLPVPEARPDRDEVVRAAVARSGDLVLANVFAQVACLEIEAQATSHALKMNTFAAGSDIHAPQVRQAPVADAWAAEHQPLQVLQAAEVRQARVRHAGVKQG